VIQVRRRGILAVIVFAAVAVLAGNADGRVRPYAQVYFQLDSPSGYHGHLRLVPMGKSGGDCVKFRRVNIRFFPQGNGNAAVTLDHTRTNRLGKYHGTVEQSAPGEYRAAVHGTSQCQAAHSPAVTVGP
jgi:hypothetical protein